MKDKIAVITMYYNSTNYGGVLQSYALIKVLEKLGYNAQQISYNRLDLKKEQNFIFSIIKRAFNCLRFLMNMLLYISIRNELKVKKYLFTEFRNSIPHTKVYNDKNIKALNEVFDTFIVGSDQVWHPANFESAYSLSFVNSSKKRIAYAASIAHPEIPENKKVLYKRELSKYSNISVREVSSVFAIKNMGFKVERTLDPTLLLSKAEWEKVLPKPLYKFKYILCYLFEKNEMQKRLIKKVSQEKQLPIINISYLNNKRNRWNTDHEIVDASPFDLLALIRDANYIFTDSYHVSVFSCIFGKDFYVFSRRHMTSRIETLLSDFNCQDRFISEDKYGVFEVKSLSRLPNEESILALRDKSISFLKNAIEKTEKI